MLWAKAAPGENLIVRGARVLDPAAKVDWVMDVRIDGGTIAELGARLRANGVGTATGQSIREYASVADAYDGARDVAGADDRILAFGSFLTVADVMRAIDARRRAED